MISPIVQFGLETEVGIHSDPEGEMEVDVVSDSIALVRSATEPGVWMRWDYECEDPHVDMRGFRVRQLRQDSDEAEFHAQDAERELSFVEIKSDLVLGNGARFYNDHAHPEYCTPECRTVEELVLHDRAGERILMACARHLNQRSGVGVRLYKNNTDFRGHSYGCHENYLLPRSLAWERLVAGVQAFLVTRQIYAGAGKFALEAEDRFLGHGFQISQRSDFFTELQSVDTMQRRPIVNTRDEPHANPLRFRRFHVILGDANMSPFATRLKVGATALVLEALALDPKRNYPALADPLRALKAISRDVSFRQKVPLGDGTPSTAIAIQRGYLEAVRNLCDLSDPSRATLVEDWESVLDDLESDPIRCKDRLDWVAKRELVLEFQRAQGISDKDPWLHSLDLEYHRLDVAEGLYYGLEQSGAIRGVPEEKSVRRAVREPPSTRAWIRGRLVQRFADSIIAAQWDHITLRGREGPIKIPFLDLFTSEEVRRCLQVIEAAETPEDLRILA